MYVGNLPPDVSTRDIEDIFDRYGKTSYIDLKNNRGGPPFAFVEFDDPRDADDAVHERDGYNFDGYTLRVEFPRGGRGGGMRGGGSFGGGGGGFRSRGGPPQRRSGFRVAVSGLPVSGSWQDLKDHMREAGEVGFADVFKDGSGVVEFARHDDMKHAVRKLDDSKFTSRDGETAYIRLKEESGGGSRGGRSGPPSGGRDRRDSYGSSRRSRGSPSYEPVRRSRSRSPY